MAVPDIQISELEQTLAQNLRRDLTSYENVTAMLQKAGLAEHSRSKRNSGSISTQSRSLDQTEVSVETTYSQRLEWDTEDTILKIISLLQDTKTIKFQSLLAMDSGIGPRHIKVARCFMSLLKLKQHGFIKITKDPNTLEIVDIALGPKFD